MTTASSKNRYARFIPSEEVGDVTQWRFGAVGSAHVQLSELETTAEAEAETADAAAARMAQEALQQAALQQASDDAYALGLQKGREQATAEWQRRMDDYVAGEGLEAARRLDAAVQALSASLDAMQQHMAQDVLQLACDIARQVVRQELRSNPDALRPVVGEALGMLVADGKPATVRLSPTDHAAVAAALREEFSASPVQWLADAAVPPGGCQVEAAGAVVDGSLDKRWQRAIAPLGLASAWSSAGDGDGI